MYPAFDWSVSLLAIMDISAGAISLAERPDRAIWVTSVRTRLKRLRGWPFLYAQACQVFQPWFLLDFPFVMASSCGGASQGKVSCKQRF
jgi:hypothetical protein